MFRFMTSKLFVSCSVLGMSLGLPAIAHAQQANNPNCPPGSWFCADAPMTAPAPATPPAPPEGKAAEPKGDTKTQAAAPALQQLPPPAASAPATQSAPPPVVYQAPPPVIVVAPPPARYEYQPRPAESWQRRREWGLNLHLQGVSLGKGYDGNASMGGAGLGARFRVAPFFAIQPDLDFVGGRDYQGMKRNETAFSVNALFFVNPKSRVQFYMLAGIGWSAAHVVDDRNSYEREYDYGYFGGQIGAGLEFRIAKHFALDLDFRGFMRGRTGNTDGQAEFRDPSTGRTTNTSGGGVLQAGMTFYF